MYRIESRFDRKFGAVFATAKKIAPDSVCIAARLGNKMFAMAWMSIAETFRNQGFNLAADQLAERIAEDRCCRRIGEVDHTG